MKVKYVCATTTFPASYSVVDKLFAILVRIKVLDIPARCFVDLP